ncbi:MAG: diguanylate cyclase [Candidatus Dormibacteraeota bacterium]|uniref:Diguanylate cyclase n=1 Tax=Candidatus Dormiibacter inghamiae TaxID=3127013 RepID=A0A934K6I1_9BACT|nr:diguanylate cyclase [Candidatus Dormibacteraeota bacterium]MBJ7605664.1 diguanylate cyclase [Candidatus Dormibacteraeota bacterium]
MPLPKFLRSAGAETKVCGACGAQMQSSALFCSACGVRLDEPDSMPLHIVDRSTGLFNERFLRPVLEDELARAHRYGRSLGVVLVQPFAQGAADSNGAAGDQTLELVAEAVTSTLRDVDTTGVLARQPPSLLALLPDTDIAGTAYAANRLIQAVNGALQANGRRAGVGVVCVHYGQRLRAGTVIEAAERSLRTGRPELLGR